MMTPSNSKPSSPLWAWIKSHRTAFLAVGFWLLILLVVRQYMQANALTFTDLADQLSRLLRETWYGPLLYVVVYIIRPLILFPASLLTILGGSVFGLWPGFAYVLFAGTASSTLPYLLGRWFTSDQQQTQGESILQRFIGMLKRHPFQAVLTMRLIYLPYDAVSLVAGSLAIPFLIFLLATALGNVAGTLSFVGIGASIEGDLTTGDVSLNPAVLAFSVVVLIVSLALSRVLNRSQQQPLLIVSPKDEE